MDVGPSQTSVCCAQTTLEMEVAPTQTWGGRGFHRQAIDGSAEVGTPVEGKVAEQPIHSEQRGC